MGLDFVGVCGHGSYLPFLRFAEALKIPWIIFSDGEPQVKKSIQKTLKKLYNTSEVDLGSMSNVFILDNECDFELFLIDCGYTEEIKLALTSLHSETYLDEQIRKQDGTKGKRIKTDKTCNTCEQSIYKDILRDYSGDEGFKRALYDCMASQKTKFGPVIAEQIIQSDKSLPPKVIELFKKITVILQMQETGL